MVFSPRAAACGVSSAAGRHTCGARPARPQGLPAAALWSKHLAAGTPLLDAKRLDPPKEAR